MNLPYLFNFLLYTFLPHLLLPILFHLPFYLYLHHLLQCHLVLLIFNFIHPLLPFLSFLLHTHLVFLFFSSLSYAGSTTNVHPMPTISKCGMFKSKVFMATTNDFSITTPTTHNKASKYIQRRLSIEA